MEKNKNKNKCRWESSNHWLFSAPADQSGTSLVWTSLHRTLSQEMIQRERWQQTRPSLAPWSCWRQFSPVLGLIYDIGSWGNIYLFEKMYWTSLHMALNFQRDGNTLWKQQQNMPIRYMSNLGVTHKTLRNNCNGPFVNHDIFDRASATERATETPDEVFIVLEKLGAISMNTKRDEALIVHIWPLECRMVFPRLQCV